MSKPTTPPRVRRSAAEARERILQAAGTRLLAHGPAALRLQELARDLGVSHPTILHHFGSRDALVREVLNRAIATLEDELIRAVTSLPFDEAPPTEVLRRALFAFTKSGSARLVAYLALEATGTDAPEEPHLRRLAEVIHARRVTRQPDASFEDTMFVVMSVALAVLLDALVGENLWKTAGLPRGAQGRFHDWLIHQASERIERTSPNEKTQNATPATVTKPKRTTRRRDD